MGWIYGIDETCKCPVIGTIPICILKVKDSFFRTKDARKVIIRDSKLTTKNQRKFTFNVLKDKVNFSIRRIYPYQMEGNNVIDLEVNEIIQGLRELDYKDGEKVYIDLFDSSREKLIERFRRFGFNTDFDTWVLETGADGKYKCVSLASMISKFYSDKEFDELNKYFDIGNGNPGNLKTLKFIIDNYDNLPWFVRKSWITVQRLKDPEYRNKVKLKVEELQKQGKKITCDLYDNI